LKQEGWGQEAGKTVADRRYCLTYGGACFRRMNRLYCKRRAAAVIRRVGVAVERVRGAFDGLDFIKHLLRDEVMSRIRGFLTSVVVMVISMVLSELTQAQDVAAAARGFVKEHEGKIQPLQIASARAWWNANVTGKDGDFAAKEAAENQVNEALADPQQFARLKAIHAGQIGDQVLARTIEVLHLQYLEKQVDPALMMRMTAKANTIEKAFNVFRAKVGEKSYTDGEVRQILQKSKDSAERRGVWEASKRVGVEIENDLRDLVRLRNEAATRLGFADYHALQLHLSELSQAQVLKLFDELDELTREPFARAKAQIDEKLAKDYGVKPADLAPWHYHDPFFQEAPAVYDIDLDAPFANADIQRICREFYAAIGLPIEDVLARSDLYEKPGKSPHAFCTDIDNAGDVRVLANIRPTEYWTATMLHELGHAVYSSKNIPAELPFALRSAAHILTTEGVAMMFERFSKSANWLQEFGVEVPDRERYSAAGARMRRDRLLIFSRWCQVMFRFEKELYRDPSQDLNKLWWDLVEKYQLLKRPEGRNSPDYASKIHIVSAPAYYHNYLLGQLFACQLHAAIARDVLKNNNNAAEAIYTRDPRVGQFLKDKVFSQGALQSWNDLTRYATGDELNAKAFAAEFK
jgi:peptidyl-dipeptidase A